MHLPASPDSIDEQAALWAARLDGGSLADGEKAELSAWLAARVEHRTALARYQALSATIEAHTEARVAAAVDAVLQERAAARRRQPFMLGALAVAAVITLLLLVHPGRSLNFATQMAERHVTTLEDGSKIDLNACTELSVVFTSRERRVRLVSGEALFDVAQDPSRPFLVETAAGLVRVTGTVFNIRATSGDLAEVTVLEGTVRVRPRHRTEDEQPVVAGVQAVLRRDTVAVHPLPDGVAQDVIAWRLGQVVFNKTPLSAAVGRFAAYHARRIVVDPSVAELCLGGRYSLDDLTGWLESVEAVLPVRVSHLPDNTIRLSSRPADPTQ